MAKKKLTKAEIRRRQQKAGAARKGARVKPANAAEASDAGYVVRYRGSLRHADRNREIVEKVGAAPAGKRQQVIRRLADRFGIGEKHVDNIARYYKDEVAS